MSMSINIRNTIGVSLFYSFMIVSIPYSIFWLYFMISKHKFNSKPVTMYDKFLDYAFVNSYTCIPLVFGLTIILSPLIFFILFFFLKTKAV
jgi:hypothetical protein